MIFINGIFSIERFWHEEIWTLKFPDNPRNPEYNIAMKTQEWRGKSFDDLFIHIGGDREVAFYVFLRWMLSAKVFMNINNLFYPIHRNIIYIALPFKIKYVILRNQMGPEFHIRHPLSGNQTFIVGCVITTMLFIITSSLQTGKRN